LKYRDEKYVEALEQELAELRRQARVTKATQGDRKRADGSSAVHAEDLYRRARIEVAAEAGAGYGRVSLEALYLLPSEFTNVYQRLFLQALKESPGQTGEANPLVKRAARLIKKEEGDVLDRDPDRGGGSARGGGKRHRDHWLIKDERAFRLKKNIDDQLRELATVVALELADGRAADSSRAAGVSDPTIPDQSTHTPQCAGCQRFLKSTWHYCPGCGTRRG